MRCSLTTMTVFQEYDEQENEQFEVVENARPAEAHMRNSRLRCSISYIRRRSGICGERAQQEIQERARGVNGVWACAAAPVVTAAPNHGTGRKYLLCVCAAALWPPNYGRSSGRSHYPCCAPSRHVPAKPTEA